MNVLSIHAMFRLSDSEFPAASVSAALRELADYLETPAGSCSLKTLPPGHDACRRGAENGLRRAASEGRRVFGDAQLGVIVDGEAEPEEEMSSA